MQHHGVLTHTLGLAMAAMLLLAACSVGRRGEMLAQLEELERQNRADSVMQNDSLARTLTEYFDSHGSPNERMRAHYILGRTYADMGELPEALEAYNDAAECADTTSSVCDYYTLCRVYSQIAALFYKQNLLDDNLRCLDLSIAYALKANDSIAAINSYGQKLGAYDRRHITDSIISVSTQTFEHFSKVGFPEIGSRYLSFAVIGYTQKGNLSMARHYMNIYELQSGYFDSLGNIEKGREVYYGIKGKLFYAASMLDSAKFYFQKQFVLGHDFNNQNIASSQLAKIYYRTGKMDSASKYALYAYDMNDSCYSQTTTEALTETQASYNYSSHQRIAQKERVRAESERQKARVLLCIIIGSILVSIYIAWKLKRQHKAERASYMAKVDELERVQNDVLRLRSHETELDSMLLEKKSKLEELKGELAKFNQPVYGDNDTVEEKLKKSAIYLMLLSKADKGELLASEDWHELNRLIIELLPNFYQLLSSKEYNLSISEYRITLLLRLHVKPKAASNLLGCSPQYVTKLSRQVITKLFKLEGSSKDLAKVISELT